MHAELLIEAFLEDLHELLGEQRLVPLEPGGLLAQIHHNVVGDLLEHILVETTVAFSRMLHHRMILIAKHLLLLCCLTCGSCICQGILLLLLIAFPLGLLLELL